MATTSITRAVIDKFEGLTASNFPSGSRPRIDFGEAPYTVSGSAHEPPYVVLIDLGRETRPADFERNTFVTASFALEIFAVSLADVDAITEAVRFNGGGVGDGSGFDYGSLDLTGVRSTHQIIPTAEPRSLSDRVDKSGNRVHGCRLEYRVTVLERA
jgi:hypothetical protein